MNEIKIISAIVVYNKELEKSLTYNNMKAFPGLSTDILIIDNSEIETRNKSFCESQGIRYISMNGNAGLSKAYNAAVDASRDADVLVLLDDDTAITEEYFAELRMTVDMHPEIDIFAPIIYGQDGVIYSPNEFSFLKNHFIESPEQEVSQDKFNAIASCLAIRMRVFDNYRFDENLFVDQVDQYFFCEQRKLGRRFYKLNTTIQQNFYQRGETLKPQAAWNRLRLRIVDIMIHARLMGGIKYRFLGFIKNLGLGLQIGLKCKSLLVIFKALYLSVIVLFKRNIDCKRR